MRHRQPHGKQRQEELSLSSDRRQPEMRFSLCLTFIVIISKMNWQKRIRKKDFRIRVSAILIDAI